MNEWTCGWFNVSAERQKGEKRCQKSSPDFWFQLRGYLLCCDLSLSCVWLFATPWTVAHQAPLSMECSRQEQWSGLGCHAFFQEIKPGSPALQADSLPPEATSTFPPVSVNKLSLGHQQLQPSKMVSWCNERELGKWKLGGSSESGNTGYWPHVRLQEKVNSDSKLELFLWLPFFFLLLLL